ncbi:MAG TPA: type II toxin-antitoxin system HicB family antitoxin [Longimicrobium sp.]|nr:type II toxin-antitoxin system HicB family antitoxin [Longimicrobium sp.]
MSKYEIIIYWSEEDRAFITLVPELPGCIAHGESREQALAEAQQAIQLWIDTAHEVGRPVPDPKGRKLMLPEMRTYTAVVERSKDTGVFVAYVPGWSGAHAQGGSITEVEDRLREVIDMLLEDGPPAIDSEVVGASELEFPYDDSRRSTSPQET